MNRRDFMSRVVAGATAMQVSNLLPSRAGGAEQASTPAWLTDQPLVIVGNRDSMPIFQVRHGGGPARLKAEYPAESSETTVKKLSDMGVTLAVIHYYKGFGLLAEQPHLDVSRKLAERLHHSGIK